MVGFPKRLATKQDVLNCLELFPEETKKELQRLIDTRFTWANGKILDNATDIGQVDDDHKLVKNEDGKFVQYTRLEDPSCQLFRMGLTVAEAEELING